MTDTPPPLFEISALLHPDDAEKLSAIAIASGIDTGHILALALHRYITNIEAGHEMMPGRARAERSISTGRGVDS